MEEILDRMQGGSYAGYSGTLRQNQEALQDLLVRSRSGERDGRSSPTRSGFKSGFAQTGSVDQREFNEKMFHLDNKFREMEEKFYKRINDQDIEHVMQFQKIERQIDDIHRTNTETIEKRSNSKA